MSHTDHGGGPEHFDREISVAGIVKFAIGLAITIALSYVLVLVMTRFLMKQADEADPAPLPVAVSADEKLPPLPRLQPDPEGELVQLRAHEDVLLSSYGWEDRDTGTVRVPIERAMELVLESPAVGEESAE